MKKLISFTLLTISAYSLNALAKDSVPEQVSTEIVSQQRLNLANNANGKGFGPQSPRDIDNFDGNNRIVFGRAPSSTKMNLCNIHFHKNAEHSGGEFARYAGNGKGYQSGFIYSGKLSDIEKSKTDISICPSAHGSLQAGDTIEVHYVHSSAKVKPGATLGACLSDSIKNPQLRVEAQVYVLVNDSSALNFSQLTSVNEVNGYAQASNIPSNSGAPVVYQGSTTGPSYNEQASPFLVTWSVRPKVQKVDVASVGVWCKDNEFNEDHAHGVRNLVTNLDLLSPIK